MKFSFFSFNWLGSKERAQKKEEIALKQRELDLKEKKLNKKEPDALQKEFIEQTLKAPIKPYASVRLIGNTCLVVMRDGTILSNNDPTLLGRVRQAQNEEEIIEMFVKYEKREVKQKEIEEAALVATNLEALRGHEDFDVKGEQVYLKGISLPLPPVVVASFIELVEKMEAVWDDEENGCISCEIDELEEQYQALKCFWLKLCLNGREQSRQDLLSFCRENDVRITKNGNLILYRNIVAIGKVDKPFTKFISQQYFRIKGNKKSPKNYWVWAEDDGSYRLISENFKSDGIGNNAGNLHDLYVDLPNHKENKYTSWNNKGKHEINIGSIYRIGDKDINLDNGLCAAGGIHAANVNYDYSGFGDTKVVVLVSPSKAITVPTGDRGKLRTTEMFVACLNDKEYGEHFSEEDLLAFDEEYNHLSIEELEKSLENKSFEAISVKDEVSPLTPLDMENVKTMLKERVVKI